MILSVIVGCAEKTSGEHLLNAQDLMSSSDPQAASIELKNAIKIDPTNGEARFLLAKIHLENRNYDGAKKELLRANKSGYQSHLIIPLLLKTMHLQQDYPAILEMHYDSDVLSSKDRAEVSYYYFNALLQTGDANEAFDLAESVIAQHPEGIYTDILVIYLQIAKDNSIGAEKAAEELFRANPSHSLVSQLYARILASRESVDEAISVYESHVLFHPSDVQTLFVFATYLVDNQRFERAREVVEKLIKLLGNENPRIQQLKGMALSALGEYEAAEAIFKSVIYSGLSNTRLHLSAGYNAYMLGNDEQAMNQLSKVEAVLPTSHPVHKILTSLRLRNGTNETAIKSAMSLNNLSSVDAPLLASAGFAALKLGDVESTAGIVEKLKGVSQTSKDKMKLGMLQLSLGSDEGIANMESALARDNSKTNFRILARAYLSSGKLEQLRDLIVRWKESVPDDEQPYLISASLMLKEDLDKSIDELKKAKSLFPTKVPVLYALAEAKLQQEQVEGARGLINEILLIAPDHVPSLMLKYLLDNDADRSQVLELVKSQLNDNEDSPEKMRFALATMQASERLFEDALNTLSLVEFSPSTPKAMWKLKADLLMQVLKLDVLDAHYDDWLRLFPDDRGAAIGSMLLSDHRRDYDSGIKTANKYLVSREAPNVRLMRSLFLSIKGEYLKSEADLKYLGSSAEKSPLYNVINARNLASKGDVLGALTLAESIYLDTGSFRDLMFLLSLYDKSSQPERFNDVLSDFVHNNPNVGQAKALLAERKIKSDVTSAIKEYESLLKSAPNNVLVLNNLAYLYRETGQLAKAKETGERAFNLAPQNINVADTWAQVLIATGEKNLANQVYSSLKIKANDAVSDDIYLNYVECLILNQQNNVALDVLDARLFKKNEPLKRSKKLRKEALKDEVFK